MTKNKKYWLYGVLYGLLFAIVFLSYALFNGIVLIGFLTNLISAIPEYMTTWVLNFDFVCKSKDWCIPEGLSFYIFFHVFQFTILGLVVGWAYGKFKNKSKV
jgi:hypothetical protein